MTTNTSAAWRRLTAIAIGTGAITFGGMALLAPAAYADKPKSEAQTECTQEGDEYSTNTDAGGNTTEKCCYEGMTGMSHCDVWINGTWNGDLSFHEVPPAATVVPTGPPLVRNPALAPAERITPSTPPVLRDAGQLSTSKK